MKADIVRLSDIATIDVSSVDKKSKESEHSIKLCNFTDIFYNWAITSDLSAGFMEATTTEQNISRFSLKKGQVAITKDSETREDIGMSAYIAENIPDTVLGYHCALITPQKDKIIGSYLNAYLTSPYGRKFLSYQASGSGQRYTLTVESIGAIPIILPDLDTQKDIGKFFSAIDRKIENNKKISTNIKKAAQTVYNYWFLQFEFPNETGRPYRTSGGKMVWSDVLSRDIPNEWCVKKLSDIAKYRSIAMTKVPIEFYVGVDNMYPNMEGIFESQYAPPASGLKSFETNDILIGNIRPYFKKIWFAGFDGGCNSDVLVVQAKNKSFSPFLYYALANDIFFHYDVAGSKGSKMPRGDKKHIMNYQIAVNEKIMNLFSDFVRPLLNMGNRLDIENRKLNSLRNFILPLLINQQAIFRNG